MSIFTTLYDAHLTINSHQITWREIVGNAFGFASAIGGLRRRVWAWPVGIVGNVLLFTVFVGTAFNDHTTPLLGQAGRQLFFIAVSVYGWRRWQQNRLQNSDAPAVRPRWATGPERLAYIGTAVAAVVLLFFLFRAIGVGFDYPPPTWYYLADSWIFVGSALATYAMARGWVDFWLCWIAVDLVGVPELIHFKLYPSALLYGVYLLLVLYGFFAWRRIVIREKVADPAVEAFGV
ncbi:MAG: nicotinamide mononucleotide transporter family protein [Actinomycetota bacterium]|nr:nicotinamide mononucleotide transporter family protein [Actinomycetota bacterium]